MNQHATLVNEERQTSFGQSSIHEAIWRSVSNRILASSSLEIKAYQKAESIDLDVVEISRIDLIGDSLEQLSEKFLVLKESGIDSILKVSAIPGTERDFDRLSDACNGVRIALTDIRKECKRIGISYNRLGELDLTFLKNQKGLISQLSTVHRVSTSTGVNSNFSDKLADILGFVKARESRQQHVPDWTYPLLKDGQKFSQLLECLDSINYLVKEERFVSRRICQIA